MGRWAEAFQASIVNRDTADTVDTSSGEPATAGPCVSRVSSVSERKVAAPQQSAPPLDLVSTGSTVSRPAPHRAEVGTAVMPTSQVAGVVAWCERRAAEALDGYEPPEEFNRQIVDGYLGAALRRPPSWWRAEGHRPTPGASCSCCTGQRWWSKLEDQRGWCCCTCHPPDHLAPDAVTEVRT
jgi:hypothetical protein